MWGQLHSTFPLPVARLLGQEEAFFEYAPTVSPPAQEEYHRDPVHSPLQEDGRVSLSVAEDWNVSHSVRFYWDSFLDAASNSTMDC